MNKLSWIWFGRNIAPVLLQLLYTMNYVFQGGEHFVISATSVDSKSEMFF